MTGRLDQYSGNVLLYDYLFSKRAPILLSRNLSRVSQIHEFVLEHGSTQGISGPDHDFRTAWKPPEWDDLDHMVDIEKLQGSFVLNTHGLKSLGSRQTTGEESWNKVRTLFHINCTIQLAVYARHSDTPCKEAEPQKAILKGVKSALEKKVFCGTDGISIGRDDFKVLLDEGEVGFGESYKAVLAINLECSQDAIDIYALFGHTKAEEDAQTRLVATMDNILECPQGEVLLPLKDVKTYLDFGITVSMYWVDIESESILAAHNQRLKSSLDFGHMPTPPTEADTSQYELMFVYAQETLTLSGLQCPHEACSRKKLKDIDDLRMHLLTWHDYFQYQATPQREKGDGVKRWRFDCQIADHQADRRASRTADEPLDVYVVAPSRPFNRQKYLDEGDDDFQKTARGMEKTAKQNVATAAAEAQGQKLAEDISEGMSKPRKVFAVPRAPPGVTFFRALSRRPLQEGEEVSESDDEVDMEWLNLRKRANLERNRVLPDSARRLIVVLDKFVMDENPQSDVHLGNTLIRFVRSKNGWMWRERLTEEFRHKITELLEDDVISADIHARCLRIIEDEKPKAWEDTAVLSRRPANLEVQPLSGSRCTGKASSGIVSASRGFAEVAGTGHLTPITIDSDGEMDIPMSSGKTSATRQQPPQDKKGGEEDEAEEIDDDLPFDICFCGEDALRCTRLENIVACNSMGCTRQFFHVDCVSQDANASAATIRDGAKQRTWTCRDCAAFTGKGG